MPSMGPGNALLRRKFAQESAGFAPQGEENARLVEDQVIGGNGIQ